MHTHTSQKENCKNFSKERKEESSLHYTYILVTMNDQIDSGISLIIWRWALIASSVVVLIVIIWSAVRVCRKNHVVDSIRYSNHEAVSIDDDDLDDFSPPKTNAPIPPSIEMRTKALETQNQSGKSTVRQLIANKQTNKKMADFAIGHESDSDQSM
ncbi:hypothetical protein RFI_09050 [Reticulomyxa filosa]|uniref:Uncharacterized protein n=1 Tax=Reticulomyxa filosa TaxID=46433 RepID=X6NRW5_RETFI|nr:hypothetical protein RFI_09050 [Reticulomyxa filosa]|eukprot:ETO28082.1 hypothetical protein RFI_09050 [Reticulomyxa filosa]